MSEKEDENDKPALPPGWVARESSTYLGHIYYFNTATGHTTWELPQSSQGTPGQVPASGSQTRQGGKSSSILDKILDQADAALDQTLRKRAAKYQQQNGKQVKRPAQQGSKGSPGSAKKKKKGEADKYEITNHEDMLDLTSCKKNPQFKSTFSQMFRDSVSPTTSPPNKAPPASNGKKQPPLPIIGKMPHKRVKAVTSTNVLDETDRTVEKASTSSVGKYIPGRKILHAKRSLSPKSLSTQTHMPSSSTTGSIAVKEIPKRPPLRKPKAALASPRTTLASSGSFIEKGIDSKSKFVPVTDQRSEHGKAAQSGITPNLGSDVRTPGKPSQAYKESNVPSKSNISTAGQPGPSNLYHLRRPYTPPNTCPLSQGSSIKGPFSTKIDLVGMQREGSVSDSGSETKKKKKRKKKKKDNTVSLDREILQRTSCKVINAKDEKGPSQQMLSPPVSSQTLVATPFPVIKPNVSLPGLPPLPAASKSTFHDKFDSIKSWVKSGSDHISSSSTSPTTPSGRFASMDVEQLLDHDSVIRSAVASSMSTCSDRCVSVPFLGISEYDEDIEMIDLTLSQEEMDLMQSKLESVRASMADKSNQPVGTLTRSISNHDIHEREKSEVYIVLDTNVLIRNLKFIDALKDKKFPGFGRPILVIPWVVMQELDGLKMGKNTSTRIQRKASIPVRYLHNSFLAKHPRIVGQTPKEACEKIASIQVESNDDKVLVCCFQWKDKYPGSQVVLFTNDKNLVTKAIIAGIESHTEESITGWLEEYKASSPGPEHQNVPSPVPRSVQQKHTTQSAVDHKVDYTSPHNVDYSSPHKVHYSSPHNVDYTSPGGSTTVDQHTEKPSVSRKSATTTDKSTSRTRDMDLFVDDLLCEMKTSATDSLSVVLEKEMKDVYDILWMSIILIKPPWSFRDIITCFKKHWIAVFGMMLPRSAENIIDSLKIFASNRKGPTLSEARKALQDLADLCSLLLPKSGYGNAIEILNQKLMRLTMLTDHVARGYVFASSLDEVENLVKQRSLSHDNRSQSPVSSQGTGSGTDLTRQEIETTVNKVQNKFQAVWERVLHYSQLIAQSLSLPCTNLRPDHLPSPQDTVLFLQRFYPAVSQMRDTFTQVLSEQSQLNQGTVSVTTLCNMLNHFCNEVIREEDNSAAIASTDLCIFSSNPTKKKLLHSGLQQLQTWITDLENIMNKQGVVLGTG